MWWQMGGIIIGPGRRRNSIPQQCWGLHKKQQQKPRA
jgi:hypothetical protein